MAHQDLTFINSRGEPFRLSVFGPPSAAMSAMEEPLPVLLCLHGAGMSRHCFFRLGEFFLSPTPPSPPSATEGVGAPSSRPPPFPIGGTVAPPDPQSDSMRAIVITMDLRCHGESTFNGGEAQLSLEVMVQDFRDVLLFVQRDLYPQSAIFVLGHSLGGSIVAHGLQGIKGVSGVVLLDIVEGTAKLFVQHMAEFLKRRPQSFASVEDATTWMLTSGGMRNRDGANASVPSLLRSTGGRFEWKTNLHLMEGVWGGWFEGLDEAFLQLGYPKMLCLADAERLDKTLTVGQMQGKFQLEIIGNNCGHYVMDDATAVLGAKLQRFMFRITVLAAKLKKGLIPGMKPV